MIKVKMINILNSIDSLKKIGQQELNGVQAYKIGKILKVLLNEIQLYEDARQALINEYCEKDENNNIKIIDDHVTVLPQFLKTFNDKIIEMNELELELNINEIDLNDLKEIKLSPKEILELFWLIKEKDPS